MKDMRHALQRFLHAVSWHRRLLAAGLAAAAVAFAIEAAKPAPPPSVEVMVAADDLAGGSTLSPDRLTTARLPSAAVPKGVMERSEAIGHVLAGPIRAGEVITDRRLVGPDLVAGWGPDVVAVPVRLADAAATVYLDHGDRIDLLATQVDGSGQTTVVAADVPVLSLPASSDDTSALGNTGALLLIAATPDQAAALAQAAVTSRLSFTLGP